MSIKNWPGGFVQPIPPTPAGPYQDSAAPGVWTLDQVAYWQKQGLWPTAGSENPANIGLFGGGYNGTASTNVIERISFSTSGNAVDFGDLALSLYLLGAAGSSTRGIFAGGLGVTNVLQYVTYSTSGNAADFGDLTYARYYMSCASNNTRMLNGAGFNGPTGAIDYQTIASTGNSVSFGNLTLDRGGYGAFSSTTRAVFGAGRSAANLPNGTPTNVIDYVTIATTGNATDFGDATVALQDVGGCSSNTRGLLVGGTPSQTTAASNVISYVTIASTGNATDFGDLPTAMQDVAATSNNVIGVFGGGKSSSTYYNIIAYVTIATTGNTTDFGDLSSSKGFAAGCSGSHGGL